MSLSKFIRTSTSSENEEFESFVCEARRKQAKEARVKRLLFSKSPAPTHANTSATTPHSSTRRIFSDSSGSDEEYEAKVGTR